MAALKVLFVNHSSRLSGAERVLLDVVPAFRGGSAFLFEDGPLRTALAKTGITPTYPQRPGGFANIKRDRSLWRAVPHLGGLGRMLARLCKMARRFDVVYANSQKAFVLAAVACAIVRRPLIWHLHDILSTQHFGAGQVKLTIHLANRFARRVLVPSQSAAAAFVAAGGREGLLRIVPNGLDGEITGARAASRRAHGLEFPFVFGVFSRLAPWKGQTVALEALASLPDVGCVIAGGALFGEDDYARSLVDQVKVLGIADRVRFLGHRPDVPALMKSVDAVVHPSIDPEPFGRTLIEAMLARRPVIAANAGAVPEILDDGRVGLLFPPGDHVALAERLRQVQRGMADGLLDRAEQRALTLYSAERMRTSIAEVVSEAVGRRG